MLTLQVFSRFVLGHSWTWMEEFATIMFVWMIYLAISAAVTHRKHLKIDVLLEAVPFQVKKVMLIASNVIFAAFNIYISVIMVNVIQLLGSSKTTMLGIPQQLVYIVIPIGLIISVIRLVQDTLKLLKEEKKDLGASKPSMDLDACERAWEEKKAAKAKGESV
ncbi:TRAP transporter small permease [uncultured Intestinimonas sp.]|uniref:TRAP transporter small permease n=1 Tax=uncultured Intestinimonas sp. TaxID=1689265 RepID=UPI0025DEE879|nr:TRAP transporter small permease [uncultured Intestinimonas sp.]